MAAGEIRAGRAYVELLLKDAAFVKGLRASSQRLKSFGAGMAAIGAGISGLGAGLLAPLAAAVKHFATYGSELNDMSERTGIAAGALASLGFAADMTGASMGDVEIGIKKMQKLLGGAAEGSKEATLALADLGLGLTQLKGKSPDEQFAMIGAKIAALPTATKRSTAAIAIFGKSGTMLLPMLKSMTELRQRALDLGLIPSQEAVEAADKMGDSFDETKKSVMAVAFEIGYALSGSVTAASQTITRIVAGANQWVKENHGLVTGLAAVAAGTFVAGGAITALGLSLAISGVALGGLASGITGLGRVAGVALLPMTATLTKIRSLLSGVGSIASSVFGRVLAIGQALAGTAGRIRGHVGTMLAGLGGIARGFMQIGVAGGASLVRGVAVEAAGLAGVITRALVNSGPSVAGAFANMAAVAGRAFAPVAARITARLAPVWSGIVSRFQTAVAPLTSTVGQTFGRVSDAIMGKLNGVWRVIGPRFRSAFLEAALAAGAIGDALRPVRAVASATAQRVVAAFRMAGPAIARGLVSTVVGAFRRIRAAGAATARALARGSGSIGSGLSGIASGAAGLLGMLGSTAGGLLGDLAGIVPQVLMIGGSLTSLLTPVGLLAAAVAGGVYLWTQYSEAGKSAFSSIVDALAPIVDTFKDTFSGIVDAIKAGDLALAGAIAIAGLKLAFLQGVTAIATAVGGTWGEFIGSLGSKIAGGDFAGAWTTALQGMGALWDTFSQGVVNVFTNAAKAVVKVWRNTTTAISKWLLKDASEGGILGSAALLGTGVDMKDESAKAKALDRQKAILARNDLADEQANLAKAMANGGSMTDANGDTWNVDQIQSRIEEIKQSLEALNATPTDFLADAQNNAAEQIRGTADAINSALDSVKRQADANATASAKALAATAAGGAAEAISAVEDAQAELEELQAIASQAAQAAKDKADLDKAKLPGSPDTDVLRNDVFGSFSAAALSAGGGGGGVVGELRNLKRFQEAEAARAAQRERERQLWAERMAAKWGLIFS